MKLLLVLLTLLLTAPFPHKGGKSTSRTYPAAFLPKNPLARCSGDANCRACSNCNYCGHCAGGGGTCGVCAPAPIRHTPARKASKPQVHSAAPTVLEIGQPYFVAATTLNLRDTPSADGEIVRVLERNDVVTVQEVTDAKWAKVSALTEDGEVEGYLSRAYLAAAETH